MIPEAFVTEWAERVRWPTPEQVEQDLVLSRLIVEIANDPYLGNELVFRGGTCLHKLHAAEAVRYSDDLDYVRRTAGGIAPLTRALSRLADRLGMEVRTRIGQQPKVYFRAPVEAGSATMRVKVEVNTYERSPARDVVLVPFGVESSWFRGHADVATFALPELVATKLRALYQRSKGRDLFDLWLALTDLNVAPAEILDCFPPYRPQGYTRGRAEANLREKLLRDDFRNDLNPLVTVWPERYDIDTAAELVIDRIFAFL